MHHETRSFPFAAPLAGLCALALLAVPLALAPAPAQAGGSGAGKPAAAKPAAKKRAVRRKPAPPPAPLPAPTPEQLEAAERVFYGPHQCEFGQTVDVALHAEAPGFVNVRFGKASYVMKPVVSATGAIRLEDVKGQTLLVQITAKSMLMNVKAGQRLVDECISDKHREAIELAERAAAAAALPAGASAPAGRQ